MKAGDLRHRVSVRKMVPKREADGGFEDVPEVEAIIWASIEPLQGRELLQAQQVMAEVTTRIRMRYRPSITAKHDILYGARVFNILSVINVNERNQELHLLCKEVQK